MLRVSCLRRFMLCVSCVAFKWLRRSMPSAFHASRFMPAAFHASRFMPAAFHACGVSCFAFNAFGVCASCLNACGVQLFIYSNIHLISTLNLPISPGFIIPFSVIKAVMYCVGVTSNAGFRACEPGDARRMLRMVPSASGPE